MNSKVFMWDGATKAYKETNLKLNSFECSNHTSNVLVYLEEKDESH